MIRPPAHLAPYVEILGEDLAVEFLLTFGGAELYLARNPGGMARLAQVVGQDKAAALAKAADAHRLPRRVPTGKVWIAQVLRAGGLPVAEIARRLHTSDVTVRKYLAAAPQPETLDPRQMRLL